MGKIVVGVDGSECSQKALRFAVDEAKLRGASVEAVMAWSPPYPVPVPGRLSDPEWLSGKAAELLAEVVADEVDPTSDVEVACVVEEGPASRALLARSKDADLLVVGTSGIGQFAGAVLGSVRQACVHHATCPVVVVRDGDGAAAGS